MRVIDADALKKAIIKKLGIKSEKYLLESERIVYICIDEQPTIELLKERPQKGEWIVDEYEIYHCPFCRAINNTVYKCFCPNCGADMRENETH